MATSCSITFWHVYMSFYNTNSFHQIRKNKTNKIWERERERESQSHPPRPRCLGTTFFFFFSDVFSKLRGELIWCWLNDMYTCQNVIEYDVIISLCVIIQCLNLIEWFDKRSNHWELYSFFFLLQNLKSCCTHNLGADATNFMLLELVQGPLLKLPQRCNE
jgi:hypothetical protein